MKLTSANGDVAYLQETSVNAIRDFAGLDHENFRSAAVHRAPVAAGPKRAQAVTAVGQMSDNGFSTFCYHAADGGLYYSNVKSSRSGELSEDKVWPADQSLRFYAVHPYDATQSRFGGDAAGVTYDYTLNTDVESQVDLMYASTDVLAYRESGTAPLNFRHALAAVQFSLGSNPDFGVNITSLKIKNVYTKGTLTLPSASTADATDPAEAAWSNLNTTGDVVLTGLNQETDGHANMAITSPTQTFMVLPRADLDGVGIEIGFSDGTTMSVIMTSGEWKAGYTYTYKLSKQAETFTYTLNTYGNYTNSGWGALYYNEDVTWNYCLVQSYKTNVATGVTTAVPWEAAEYEYSDDAGATWHSTGTSYPSWLADFPDAGPGSTSWQGGYAYVTPDGLTESISARDLIIQGGTVRTDYDLSTHDINGNTIARSTANCYVVSGPGTYKLPLVYGNAIKNGATNSVAYSPVAGSVDGVAKLTPFLNYLGTGITDPWIKTDGTPTSAELVWADSYSLYQLLSGNVSISGDYLCFDASDVTLLRAGNAVLAVKDANGDIMWSWQIWFAPDNVLDEIPVYSTYYRKSGTFATEPIGYRTGNRFGTSYTMERRIRVRIVQTEGNPGDIKQGYIYIGQEPYGTDIPTQYALYQWGRKDAMPGSNSFWPQTGFSRNGSGPVDYATAIKNPGVFYASSSGQPWQSTYYPNPWSAQNAKTGNDWEYVYKTVYDPSPAGFHVPNSSFLRSMGETRASSIRFQDEVEGHPNISAAWDNGLSFYTTADRTATIFFPACGMRKATDGTYTNSYIPLGSQNSGQPTGHYWGSNGYNTSSCPRLMFGYQYVYVTPSVSADNPAAAEAVFPMKE